MKLAISKNADINYLAKVVQIENFRKHSNPEVERLKCCSVDGFNIITGIDSLPGLYVYFPVMCCINPDFLRYANLYRHKELNNSPEKSGMFEDNGRVKAISLKGEKSEGFIIDYQILENWIVSVTNKDFNFTVGQEFDSVEDGSKSFWVCKKYIIVIPEPKGAKPKVHKVPEKLQDKVIPSQFRFHYSTLIYKKVPYFVKPDDIIQISSKIHGCVEANTLVETDKGTFKIKDIVDNRMPVNIKAYDTKTNQIVYVPIDNYYLKENDGEWYEIELEDGRTIKITGNNPVWLPELNCYRRTDQLKIGDSVLTV